jgi:hypothetical protein
MPRKPQYFADAAALALPPIGIIFLPSHVLTFTFNHSLRNSLTFRRVSPLKSVHFIHSRGLQIELLIVFESAQPEALRYLRTNRRRRLHALLQASSSLLSASICLTTNIRPRVARHLPILNKPTTTLVLMTRGGQHHRRLPTKLSRINRTMVTVGQ